MISLEVGSKQDSCEAEGGTDKLGKREDSERDVVVNTRGSFAWVLDKNDGIYTSK